jgi:hypothetical protein
MGEENRIREDLDRCSSPARIAGSPHPALDTRKSLVPIKDDLPYGGNRGTIICTFETLETVSQCCLYNQVGQIMGNRAIILIN